MSRITHQNAWTLKAVIGPVIVASMVAGKQIHFALRCKADQIVPTNCANPVQAVPAAAADSNTRLHTFVPLDPSKRPRDGRSSLVARHGVRATGCSPKPRFQGCLQDGTVLCAAACAGARSYEGLGGTTDHQWSR